MMIKLVTLAVLPLAAMAKMRGETYGEETMLFPFHGRQLMGDMGGGDDGDCPDSGVSTCFQKNWIAKAAVQNSITFRFSNGFQICL